MTRDAIGYGPTPTAEPPFPYRTPDGNADPAVEDASYEWPPRIVPYDGVPDEPDGAVEQEETEFGVVHNPKAKARIKELDGLLGEIRDLDRRAIEADGSAGQEA